jgi:hypothetical protein
MQMQYSEMIQPGSMQVREAADSQWDLGVMSERAGVGLDSAQDAESLEWIQVLHIPSVCCLCFHLKKTSRWYVGEEYGQQRVESRIGLRPLTGKLARAAGCDSLAMRTGGSVLAKPRCRGLAPPSLIPEPLPPFHLPTPYWPAGSAVAVGCRISDGKWVVAVFKELSRQGSAPRERRTMIQDEWATNSAL